MKTFGLTLIVSTVATICLWQFGLGRMIWPGQAFLASLLGAVVCGITAQIVLTPKRAR
ncbi:hypothetical protein BH10ACI4_BH10ACI4_38650 [soil metagenome]